MSNEVATTAAFNQTGSMLDKIDNGANTFRATFDTTTEEGQELAFLALSDAEPLAEHIGEVINLVHFVGQTVTLTDDKTGETNESVRIIMIDDENNTYSAVSSELLRGLSTLTAIYGPPATWNEPRPIVVREQRSRRGFRFFQILPAPKEHAPKRPAK